jgi:hypothetical protein
MPYFMLRLISTNFEWFVLIVESATVDIVSLFVLMSRGFCYKKVSNLGLTDSLVNDLFVVSICISSS